MSHLKGYTQITRVRLANQQARVYRIERPTGPVWVAWRDPRRALLPQDGAPGLEVNLPVAGAKATLEPVIVAMGQDQPLGTTTAVEGASLRLRLTHTPAFVTVK